MKVQILIEVNKTGDIVFKDSYEIFSRDEFRELMYTSEETKDNIEDNINEWCTIIVDFDWKEAEELEITEEDIDL